MSDRGRRDLRRVSEGLDDILARLGMPPDLDMASMVDEWEDVAGEPFASLSRPAGFRAGELVLAAQDGAAATLLRYRLGELVERLDERYGKGRVIAVRVTVARRKNRP